MQWGSGITYLAEARIRGVPTRFGAKDADRTAHIAVIGKRGSGRGAFLANMALQDIARGLGTLVLDGAGNLTHLLLERLPADARERLVVVDPSDGEHPYSWNALDDFRALSPETAHARLSLLLAELYQTPAGPLTEFAADDMLARKDATPLLLNDMLDPKTRERALPDARARAAFEAIAHDHAPAAAAAAETGRYLAKDVLMRNVLGQTVSKFTLARLAGGPPASSGSAQAGGIVIVDLSRIRMYPTRIQPLTRLFLAAARLYESPERPVSVYMHDVLRYCSEADLGAALMEHGVAFTVSDAAYGAEPTTLREKLLLRAGSVFSFAPAGPDVPLVARIFYPYVGPDDLERLGAGQLIAALTIDSVRSRPFFASALALPDRSGVSPMDLALESRGKFTIARVAADKLFRPKPAGEEKKDGDPGSFSNAFRSIFSQRAGGSGAGAPKNPPPAGAPPAAKPAASAEKPAAAKTPGPSAPAAALPAAAPVKKRKPVDIPEKELKAMVKVKRRPGRKKKSA